MKSVRARIDSMRDTLNSLNFASKEARQVLYTPAYLYHCAFTPQLLLHPHRKQTTA